MTIYMLRFPEVSHKGPLYAPDVNSRYIDDSIERVMLWGAQVAKTTGKSVEVVSFHATQNGNRMKEYGEFQFRKDIGLVWTVFGKKDFTIYKVTDTKSYPIKMTKVGRL